MSAFELGGGGSGLFDAVAQYSYTLAANTAAGGSSSGSFIQYPLNTEDFDPAGIGSLSGNRVTLGAASYWIDGWITIFQPQARAKSKLRDITTPADLLHGRSYYHGGTGANLNDYLPVRGPIVLAGATEIELQYRVETGIGTEGLGTQVNFGVVEKYAELTIWRFAA